MNEHLLNDPEGLQSVILQLLEKKCGSESLFRNDAGDRVRTSSVMLLLQVHGHLGNGDPEIGVILNKRSKEVRQAGDLCCPGGTANGRIDPYLARLLVLPGSPLTRWPHWPHLRRHCPHSSELLALLLATALRESWEEMRLLPMGVKFLGPLPSQCLIVFRRVIHPMVGWVRWQNRFSPSWEVEKILTIPLRAFLDPSRYALMRLQVPPQLEWRFNGSNHDFPCFRYEHGGERETLWGVTYRIVTSLVEMVFDFRPPEDRHLPMVLETLDECYVHGRH